MNNPSQNDHTIVECGDTLAFHPGYYIREILEESGMTQCDFAKQLDTTPKNLSLLLRGRQSLSVDMAMKLSRMLGTSAKYWLNLQLAFDTCIAEYEFKIENQTEKEILNQIRYDYFIHSFHFPALAGHWTEQVKMVREFLKISSLTVLKRRDFTVHFRNADLLLNETDIIKANTMVQIATNLALQEAVPAFNQNAFDEAVNYALTLTKSHGDFYPLLKDAFAKAGVIFIVLPNIPGSKINGSTKKMRDHLILMVNDRRLSSDSFWFTLFHEIGHIKNEDFGISVEKEVGAKEQIANEFAQNALIPIESYKNWIMKKDFSIPSILRFSTEIDRDPGIVVGRLQNDGLLDPQSQAANRLKHTYKIVSKYNITLPQL
ncbi:HigA family addiction module antitoxin [uncultured Dubosiella sp.]|uniref:HigA family addiction module antitoxin n=1 Tax=uncultured Dubosiella sp. TaxID=1937011 RepID=UPI00272F093C|nr:HigA family addiction module antitoxin [uncultured Dubosiella sp.]